MADIFYDVDAALAEVPVNIMPLVDKATFIAIQDAVAYNAAGMALRWHFVTTAGAYTVTSVTPTTAGVHDWTDQGDSGIYTIEIPASGGTINNDTEGFGWFTGSTTAVCPWRSPVYGFRAAAINDALIDGGDLLDVSVTQFNGSAATASGGRPEVNMTHVAGAAVSTTTAQIGVNIVQISDDAVAAQNLESYCDGTTPIPANITRVIGDPVQASSGKTTNWGGTP